MAIESTAARRQTAIAGFLLLAMAASFVATDLAARDERLLAIIEQSREGGVSATQRYYSRHGYFIDFEDRLVLDELRTADYARGGVYLIGSSNLKWATALWRLPPEQQALVHNFGIGGCNDTAQRQLLEYLIEDQGLLRAGGEKTLVVFGTSYHHTVNDNSPGSFFGSLWGRHGLFAYDEHAGIMPRWRSAAVLSAVAEKARVTGFLVTWQSRLREQFLAYRWGAPELKVREHKPDVYCARWKEVLGEAWQPRMETRVAEFARNINYLRGQGVRVEVVLLPLGSWEDDLPFARLYNEQITEMCRQKQIPLHDWSQLLADDDFADSVHANAAGVKILHAKFLEIALPFLESTGALRPHD